MAGGSKEPAFTWKGVAAPGAVLGRQVPAWRPVPRATGTARYSRPRELHPPGAPRARWASAPARLSSRATVKSGGLWDTPFRALRVALFLLSSVCTWYSGYLLVELVRDAPLSNAVHSFRSFGERPVLQAPAPKRQKCDHWTPCPLNSYAYRALSGGGQSKPAKICFEDELLMGERAGNVGRGINIAIVDYVTGKAIATRYFDMYEGDNAGPMTKFIRDAPEKSLLFMVTHDDGGSKLTQEARTAIEALGSKEIMNMKFRSSWVFLAAKGLELPAGTQREKINHSNKAKNRYLGWPAEVQIEGCLPKEPH